LRERLDGGAIVLGGWAGIPSAFSAELLASVRFDWIAIDMQHGLVGYQEMVAMTQAVDVHGGAAVVRVPWNEPSAIMRALDAGAAGVIVPFVETAEQAAAAAGACRFAPEGYRSWGPTRPALADSEIAPESENERVICAVMIESAAGLENLDAIAAIAGIDALFVGPWDLSLSLTGRRPDPGGSGPEIEAIARVVDACARHDLVPAIAGEGIEHARRWRQLGFRMIALESDVGLIRRGATASLEAARVELV
jgi:4-hydroxy-2-oxoheptanedioate aldolase